MEDFSVVYCSEEEEESEKTLNSVSITNKYVIKSQVLGKGSQGVVKKCIRIADNKEFAVKIIYKDQLSKRHIISLQREIKILKKLSNLEKKSNSKHFIKLVDHYETTKKIYLVLNLCTGGDLYDYLKSIHGNSKSKNRVNEESFKSIFYQICRGVHIAHKNGIAHRDLKPENILFSDKTLTKINISDFGLSNINKSKMTTRCGSPNYVAPEVLRNKYYDSKCDWWSCGVILYVCLSGRYPFYHRNKRIIYNQILSGKYNFNSVRWNNISPEAKDLISKLLTQDPNQRLSFTKILRHPWMLSLNFVPRKSKSQTF